MDMQKTAREIGLFETAINLAKVGYSQDVIQKVGASMPLPSEDILDRAKTAAEWLVRFGKRKYMFLTPEIALMDEMKELIDDDTEIILAIPSDMEHEAKDRLSNNLPQGMVVTVLEEPFFPESFLPGDSMLVICGYLGGGRAMALSDTFRMAEHYKCFLGKKVFVPYTELNAASRYDGWMELRQQKFSAIWREQE